MQKTIGCLILESWHFGTVPLGARAAHSTTPTETARISTPGSSAARKISESHRVPNLLRPTQQAFTRQAPNHFERTTVVNRKLGGRRLIDWVLHRAAEAQQLDELVVLLPVELADQDWAAMPRGATVFQSTVGPLPERLIEYLDRAAKKRTVTGMVPLRLDAPLLDPCLIDRLVASVRQHDGTVDYATYCPNLSVAKPNPRSAARLVLASSQLGLITEYLSTAALRKVVRAIADDAKSTQPSQTTESIGQCVLQGMAQYIHARPELFSMRLLQLPAALDRADLRFVLRSQDDWDHAEQIVDALKDDQLDWQAMVRLMQNQPGMRQEMANLNQQEIPRGRRLDRDKS